MRLENEERFALDNNNLILDMEDTRQKYNLEPEEVCELLNKQDKEIKRLKNSRINLMRTVITITDDILDKATKADIPDIYYDKLLDYLYRLFDNTKGEENK